MPSKYILGDRVGDARNDNFSWFDCVMESGKWSSWRVWRLQAASPLDGPLASGEASRTTSHRETCHVHPHARAWLQGANTFTYYRHVRFALCTLRKDLQVSQAEAEANVQQDQLSVLSAVAVD